MEKPNHTWDTEIHKCVYMDFSIWNNKNGSSESDRLAMVRGGDMLNIACWCLLAWLEIQQNRSYPQGYSFM